MTITALEGDGNPVAEPVLFDLWLSDDADGDGLTGTTASGTVQAKAASGEVIATPVARKAPRVQALRVSGVTMTSVPLRPLPIGGLGLMSPQWGNINCTAIDPPLDGFSHRVMTAGHEIRVAVAPQSDFPQWGK